jgi:hypothetical protein
MHACVTMKSAINVTVSISSSHAIGRPPNGSPAALYRSQNPNPSQQSASCNRARPMNVNRETR